MSTERVVICQTDIACRCGGIYQVEEPGSETSRWLRCPSCGSYLYVVGENMLCVREPDPGVDVERVVEQVRAWQRDTSLHPWITERLAEIRRKLGLEEEEPHA